MIGIYKITNPKGRIYIGQSVNTATRLGAYKRLQCKGQTKLYNSLLKYGFSAHLFEVVEKCSIEELNVRERHWQDFYDVLGESGLNCKLTGTEDRSGKVSADSDRKRVEKHRKTIIQYSLEGVFIGEWNSIKEAGEALGIQRGNIPACCRKESKSAGGFLWRYKVGVVEQVLQLQKPKNRVWSGRSRRLVLQFTEEGIYVREWSSIREAAEALKIRETGIINCCKERNVTSRGFIWKYK